MVGRLASGPTLEPITVAPLDLLRNLTLGVEAQGDLLDPPRRGQQPRRLALRIGNPFPLG
jgi:hypothetical protein